jgi:membrane-bound serine protease (ClpP class)
MNPVARRVAALTVVLATSAAPASAASVARIVIDGTINPAVADFVHEAITKGAAEGDTALLVQLDTPGGLLASMKVIVKDVLDAPLPVIVWVAPSGAGAGSAGVFITMAGHVAAMAPGTNIGAAHPVQGSGEDIKGTLGEKITSFTASFSEAIAQRRGRNAEWAAKSVRESVSITAEEAARIKVVDFVAKDLDEVVRKAEGREVDVAGTKRKLAFAAARDADGTLRVRTHEMSLAQRVLNYLADPNIAYLLMLAGVLGLYVEFTNPGVVFPGVAGAICLMLALAAMHVLPVNISGLGLLALGVALLIAEAFLPTFGLVGVGGIIAVVLGSLFLFDHETGIRVSPGLVYGVGGTAGAAMLGLAVLVYRSQSARPTHGTGGMVGERGVARERLAPSGTVLVRGEYWTAESDVPVEPGERVEVTGVDGLVLRVRRAAQTH